MQSLVKRENPSEPEIASNMSDKDWDKRNDQIVQVNQNADIYQYDQIDYDRPERNRSTR